MTEKENLDYWEMVNQGNWNAMYDFEENELDTISSQIDKLKDKESIKNSETHIRELREKIESEFTKMTEYKTCGNKGNHCTTPKYLKISTIKVALKRLSYFLYKYIKLPKEIDPNSSINQHIPNYTYLKYC